MQSETWLHPFLSNIKEIGNMTVTVENISEGKIIGFGDVTVLPGQTGVISEQYANNPVIDMYKNLGFIRVTRTGEASVKAEVNKNDDAIAAEELRKARLASLNGISEEGLASLANQLGINPATCKDQADVLKKVKACLK